MLGPEIEKLIFVPPNTENNMSNSKEIINVDIDENHGIKSKNIKLSDITMKNQDDEVTKLRDNLMEDIKVKDVDSLITHIDEYKKLNADGNVLSLGDPRLCVHEETTLLRMAIKEEFDFAFKVLLELSDIATIFKSHTINPEFIGGTVLHDAIANDMQNTVTLLSEKLTTEEFHALMSCKATGTFFKDYFHGYELPLTIACWVRNYEMVKLLLRIDPLGIYIKDTNGNNLLHSLILMCGENREEIKKFTTMLYMMIFESEGGKVALQYLLQMKDNTNQTPMMLAFRKGNFRFAQLILDTIYKETKGKYGPASFVNFDITEIEHCPEIKNPGLPGIMYVGTSSTCKCLPHLLWLQPWDKLLKLRWEACKWRMFVSMLIHYVMLICFTVVITITPSNEELADMHNKTELERLAANESHELTFFEQRGYYGISGMVQFIGECIFILHGAAGFITTTLYILGSIIKYKGRGRLLFNEVLCRLVNPVTGSLYYAIAYIIFSVCLVLTFAFKTVTLDHFRNPIAAISIVCGFLYQTIFFRAFDYTSFFTVTINRMLFGDVFRFIFIVSGYFFGFATAFYILYKNTAGGPPSDMENYPESLLTTYKLMLGLVDLKTMKVEYEGILVAFYVIYTILMTVMLFNMLIGIMAHTINETCEERQYLSKVQCLSTILILEDMQLWSKGFVSRAIKNGKLKIRMEMFAGREQKRLFLECMETEHQERFCTRKDCTNQKCNQLKKLETILKNR